MPEPGEEEIKFTNEQRHDIEINFLLVALKTAFAEIASINRTPSEANAYLLGLHDRLQSAIAAIMTGDSAFRKAYLKEMTLLTNELFHGIVFKSVKK